MDPYEEIVEKLRSAREQGLQTVKEKLEGILGSLETANAAVRDAMLLEADDLASLGEIPAEMEQLRETAREAALVPPPIVTLDLLRELDGAGSQSDLLHGLMSALTGHAARAVVLVFRTDAIGAWSAIGFEDASHLETWSCDRGESAFLDSFVDDPAPQQFEPEQDPVVRRWLEGELTPTEALLVPINLRGKTMGAVYVDRLEDRPWNPEAVQILVALSCWMIDTLKYRAAAGSPALAPIGGVAAQAEPEAEPGDLEAEQSESPEESTELEGEDLPGDDGEPEDEDLAPTEDVPDVEEPAHFEEEPPTEDTIEMEESEESDGESVSEEPTMAETALDEMAGAPDFDPSATVQVETEEPTGEIDIVVDDDEPEPAPSVDEDLVEAHAETAEAVEVEAPEAETDVQVPPPVEPVVPPPDLDDEPAEASQADLSPEDESRHEEARRFARLLVSEIKLYNEEAVERGREQRDLYARLKEDIDRSREMYERRIPPEIRTARDYFHDELVRILGDGDSDSLGM